MVWIRTLRSELTNENAKLNDRLESIKAGAKRAKDFTGRVKAYADWGLRGTGTKQQDALAVFDNLMPIERLKDENKRREQQRDEWKQKLEKLREENPDLAESESESDDGRSDMEGLSGDSEVEEADDAQDQSGQTESATKAVGTGMNQPNEARSQNKDPDVMSMGD